MAKQRAMDTRNPRFLTLLLGLALALVGALTLTSYVMVGQRAGSDLGRTTPRSASGKVIAARPDVSQPLVLPPVADQPAPKPEPQPDGTASFIASGSDLDTPAAETTQGTVVAEVEPDVVASVSGHIGAVLRKGAIPPPDGTKARTSPTFQPVQDATTGTEGPADDSSGNGPGEDLEGKPDDDSDDWAYDDDEDDQDWDNDDESDDDSDDDWAYDDPEDSTDWSNNGDTNDTHNDDKGKGKDKGKGPKD